MKKRINVQSAVLADCKAKAIVKECRNTPEEQVHSKAALAAACAARDDALVELKEAIQEVEYRVKVRKLDPVAVLAALADVEVHLGISKTALDGVSVEIDHHAARFPGAYRYPPKSTQCIAQYRRGAWYITSIYRARVKAPKQAVVITLTDAARDAVLARASNPCHRD